MMRFWVSVALSVGTLAATACSELVGGVERNVHRKQCA
jgi:hypothetical protein